MWLWSSKLMSKSPVKKRGSRDKIMGIKKSESSSIKLIIVTGLVLSVRSTIYYSQCKAWIFEDLMETIRNIQKTLWTKLEFAKKTDQRAACYNFFNLVFLLKCLNGATDLNVHDFVSSFYLTGVASQGSWGAVRTRPIGSTTFYVCFPLSIIILGVSYTFDFYRVLYYCTRIIWVIPNKAVEKINK